MTLRVGFFWSSMIALACVCPSGCTPASSTALDEEKEPHFLAGKSRVMALDYVGAIECFEKALHVNPNSASAHFELACIYDDKEGDPASAIYHYKHYLQLSPHAANADLMKQHIMTCKQALAESVSFGPVTDKIQRQVEQTAEENKRLTGEVRRLNEELQKWISYAARLQNLTNAAAAPRVAPGRSEALRAITTTQPAARTTAAPAPETATTAAASLAAPVRSHTVKAGETPTQIAKKYGVRLEALMAANPTLEARRLKVGQTLRIPGS